MRSASPALDAEAEAFDRQNAERVANGHVPDLRRAEPCDWFYNNPWRRPAYAELEFGEQAQVVRDAIRRYVAAPRSQLTFRPPQAIQMAMRYCGTLGTSTARTESRSMQSLTKSHTRSTSLGITSSH